jgi:Flp pilus assembly pilin Flp
LQALRFSEGRQKEEGVSSIEYALLAFLIAVFCVAIVTAVGANTLSFYTVMCSAVATAAGQPPC